MVAASVPSGLAASPGNNAGVSDPVVVSGEEACLDLNFGYKFRSEVPQCTQLGAHFVRPQPPSELYRLKNDHAICWELRVVVAWLAREFC